MAVNSMTGFGRAQVALGEFSLTVEVRSVNHRYGEFSVHLPRELLVLEEAVRASLAEFIARGRVDVYVSFDSGPIALRRVQVDWLLLEALRGAEREIRERIAPAEPPVSVAEWLKHPDVLVVEPAAIDLQRVQNGLLAAVREACEGLTAMRRREGERLEADLKAKVDSLQTLVAKLTERAPQVVAGFSERLQKRLAVLPVPVDRNRVAAEVALMADRAAIDEELVRLHSHLDEFVRSLESGNPVGRRLDFIVQELQREFNTMASKASDLVISRAVVDGKAIVEQLREQVQNIE